MDYSPSSPALPTELWDQILGLVALGLPDVAERPLTREPPSKFLASRSALFNMCRVSRKLNGLARPLLFKHIVISEADSLLLLWRTLKCSPDLGSFVRDLAFWITLTRQSMVKSVMEAMKKKLKSSHLLQDQHLYQALIDIHGDAEYDMPQFIVFDILCRTPHLNILSLQVPRMSEDINYVYLMRMITGSSGLDAQPTQTVPRFDQPLRVGRLLTMLQLCLDHEVEDEDVGFDHQDYWPLFGMSNLTRLHCWGDRTCRLEFQLGEESSEGLAAPPKGYLGNIQQICLDASASGLKTLYSLCRNAPHLQSLKVRHRRHSQDQDSWFWGQPSVNNLDRGLLLRSATLRHLHLDFYDSCEYKHYVGPDQRLTCLPQLCHLETLQIQLQTLFGTRRALSSCDIRNMFPHSLVELTLDDMWDQDVIDTEDRIRMYSGLIDPEEFEGGWRFHYGTTEAGFWYTYGRKVMKLLVRLCEVSAERLPRLRRVHYVSDYWSRRLQGYPREGPFDNISAMFRERSIEFFAGEKSQDMALSMWV